MSAVPEASTIVTSSPKVGEAGKVTVIAPEEVFTKYPSPAVAVKLAVFSDCHDVQPPKLVTVALPKSIVAPLPNSTSPCSVIGPPYISKSAYGPPVGPDVTDT